MTLEELRQHLDALDQRLLSEFSPGLVTTMKSVLDTAVSQIEEPFRPCDEGKDGPPHSRDRRTGYYIRATTHHRRNGRGAGAG